MKKIFLALAAAAALFVGCTKELEQRVGDLETSVEQIKSDLKALEEAVAQKLVVNKMETVENGYKLTFSNGTTVTLQNGAKGDKGDPGTPGAPGQKGEDGDAFFESVVPSEDGAFLVVTLVADENGEVKVYKLPMGAFNIMFETSDFVDTPNAVVSVPYTVSGAKEGDVVVRVLTTKNCEAVVDAANKKVNVTLGEGDSYVDVYAINNATGEIKAKTLTFYGYTFTVSDTKFYASPAGSRVEIPVTTDVKYDVEVDGSWLVFAKVETRAELRNDVIVLNAMDPNTSATDLTAKVTLKVEGKQVAVFDVIQKNYYPQWIADEKEAPVVWAESFKVSRYSDMSGAESKKGTFHFELSDNFSKGAFKVVGMFYADLYYNNGQMMQDQGGVYYADVEGDVLTIHRDGSAMSYGFTSDFDVTYNADDNAFSMGTTECTSYSIQRQVYIGEYKAEVKVETPATTDDPIAGTWNVTCETGDTWGNNMTSATGTMVITGSNGSYVIESIVGIAYNIAVTFDGSTLTGTKNGSTITFAYDAEAKKLTQTGSTQFIDYEHSAIRNIVAQKEGSSEEGGEEGEADVIAGTWDVTCETGDTWGNNMASATGTMVITGSNGSYVIESIVGIAYNIAVTFDGSTLTGTKNSSTITFAYDAEAKKLTQTGSTQFIDYEHSAIRNIVAQREGAGNGGTGNGGTGEGEGTGGETTVTGADALIGTWNETFTIEGYPDYSDSNMTISKTDDESKGQLKVRMLIDEAFGEELVCYANLSSDETTLTILSKGVANDAANVNKFESDIVCSVSEDKKTLRFTGPIITYYNYHYTNFTATKVE